MHIHPWCHWRAVIAEARLFHREFIVNVLKEVRNKVSKVITDVFFELYPFYLLIRP